MEEGEGGKPLMSTTRSGETERERGNITAKQIFIYREKSSRPYELSNISSVRF